LLFFPIKKTTIEALCLVYFFPSILERKSLSSKELFSFLLHLFLLEKINKGAWQITRSCRREQERERKNSRREKERKSEGGRGTERERERESGRKKE
jgi:hypothetical protein